MTIKAFAFLFISSLFFTRLPAQVKAVHQAVKPSSMVRGKVVYAHICLACHMADGRGVPMMNPPIVNTDYVSGDKAKLITIVLNGFKEDVEINGKSYSNVMTPHKDLKDQQIADVLTYVRKSFGNKASAITSVEVRNVRMGLH